MALQEWDIRPRVLYAEGDDSVRSTNVDALGEVGLNVGLVVMTLAQLAQYIDAGFVERFDPDVVVVGSAFPDGKGVQVQPTLRSRGIILPSIAYTQRPVFWPNTTEFCIAPNPTLLALKVRTATHRRV